MAFSGYIYYRTDQKTSQHGDFGLVLVDDNGPTDLLYQVGKTGERFHADSALEKLTKHTGLLEIYKVEPPILRAYRALLNQTQPASQTRTTRQGLATALAEMTQSRLTGVVSLYLNNLKLHYFFLFERGQRLGVFVADPHSGRLHAPVAPLALPNGDFDAFMSLSLTPEVEEMEKIAAPSRPATLPAPAVLYEPARQLYQTDVA